MRFKDMDYAGWGRVMTASGPMARPERMRALTELVAETPAPAFGNHRCYGDASLNTGGAAIRMTRMDRILSFDKATGVIEAEAGLTIGDLARVTAPQGWLPAVLPGTGFATLGGCAAMDVHGKNHHVAGSFRPARAVRDAAAGRQARHRHAETQQGAVSRHHGRAWARPA